MILKKFVLCILMTLTLILPVSTFMSAYDIMGMTIEENIVNENTIRSSDHIEYYYRWHNGILQYRRWNATRGYWIDATWLDVPEE